MDYNLVITERAEYLLDNLVQYLLFRLENEQAAGHLLEKIGDIYKRIEENPYQFAECTDVYLKRKKYREAVVANMRYVVIFRVEGCMVYILGVFHSLENYISKL
ncbi:MAG: type II toxin-antitoxin system RelE/ParE family toxin [Lachnospiraceae bacterium]|nr:type II toxin-antitoxin system RelE/ParE family toxin [Lachnospiraceae bacterium]